MKNVGINNLSTYFTVLFKPQIHIFCIHNFFIMDCFEFHHVDFEEFASCYYLLLLLLGFVKEFQRTST